MNWDELLPVIALSFIAVLTIVVFYGGYLANNNPQIYTAVVVDKFYTPSSTSTGTGVGMDGKVAVVTTYKSAQYTLQLDNGKFISVSKEMFLTFKEGDKVRIIEGFTYLKMELVK